MKSWSPATATGLPAVVLDGLAMPITFGETVAGPSASLVFRARGMAVNGGTRSRRGRLAEAIATGRPVAGNRRRRCVGPGSRDLRCMGPACGISSPKVVGSISTRNSFRPRRCVRTRLAQIPVVIVRHGGVLRIRTLCGAQLRSIFDGLAQRRIDGMNTVICIAADTRNRRTARATRSSPCPKATAAGPFDRAPVREKAVRRLSSQFGYAERPLSRDSNNMSVVRNK